MSDIEYSVLTSDVIKRFDCTDLTDVENAELFSAVQDYILKTKRFC